MLCACVCVCVCVGGGGGGGGVLSNNVFMLFVNEVRGGCLNIVREYVLGE